MIGGIFMKVWKKNLIAAAILVTVCAGIYVNWRYTEDQAAANLTDTLDTEKVMSDDNLVLSEDMAAISAGEDVATTSTDYFAAVRLSRQQARDNAVNLLQEGRKNDRHLLLPNQSYVQNKQLSCQLCLSVQ